MITCGAFSGDRCGIEEAKVFQENKSEDSSGERTHLYVVVSVSYVLTSKRNEKKPLELLLDLAH